METVNRKAIAHESCCLDQSGMRSIVEKSVRNRSVRVDFIYVPLCGYISSALDEREVG